MLSIFEVILDLISHNRFYLLGAHFMGALLVLRLLPVSAFVVCPSHTWIGISWFAVGLG